MLLVRRRCDDLHPAHGAGLGNNNGDPFFLRKLLGLAFDGETFGPSLRMVIGDLELEGFPNEVSNNSIGVSTH